jgi:hypothetical protein
MKMLKFDMMVLKIVILEKKEENALEVLQD